MVLLTVEGVYRDGKVKLVETPAGLEEEARVLVTFLPVDRTSRQAKRAAAKRLLESMNQGVFNEH